MQRYQLVDTSDQQNTSSTGQVADACLSEIWTKPHFNALATTSSDAIVVAIVAQTVLTFLPVPDVLEVSARRSWVYPRD
jgi:hypothetical protein